MIRKYKFQYKSLNDPKYIKDKEELFKERGNGWWLIDKSRYQNRRRYKNYTQRRNSNGSI